MIDSHAHLLPDFIENIDEVIKNARASGIKAVINSAIEPNHYDYAIKLELKNQDFIYTTLGFSPSYVKKLNFNLAYEQIQKSKNLTAIGEVGLDYHWIHDSFWQKREKEIFLKFIELANARQKPLVIHSRKAEENCLVLLEENAKVPVLMHCFAGSLDQAKRIIDLGWLVSIPTAVLNRKKHRQLAKNIPLESIVVETDSPFLSPVPGQKNEPAFVKYAIEEIASLKNCSFEEVDKVTTRNAQEFYKL